MSLGLGLGLGLALCFLLSSEVLLMEYCLELRSIDRLSLTRVKRSFTGSLLTRVKHLPTYGLYG